MNIPPFDLGCPGKGELCGVFDKNGLNLYNKLGRYGGAGTLVPITGFANAMVSPALEFKSEGLVTGTAAKLFTVAGPVLVFGIPGAARLHGLEQGGRHLGGGTAGSPPVRLSGHRPGQKRYGFRCKIEAVPNGKKYHLGLSGGRSHLRRRAGPDKPVSELYRF